MLFPYHLSDVVVKGLRITPFQVCSALHCTDHVPLQYYIMVLESIMQQEKSYDSLPNFTAVDCLRYSQYCTLNKAPGLNKSQ